MTPSEELHLQAAAKAMQGLLACGHAHDEHTGSVTAKAAYEMADEMIRTRGKHHGIGGKA